MQLIERLTDFFGRGNTASILLLKRGIHWGE
jgi:hypothetical protein